MIKELFEKLLAAEEVQSATKKELQKATFLLETKLLEADNEVKALWREIEQEMARLQVTSARIGGEHADYMISYSKPREVVEIADVEALPDHFVRLKKEPRKTELLEFLKQCHETNNPLPNYATIKLGDSKLGWKPIKKGKEVS